MLRAATIVLVDDDPDFRGAVADVFRKRGCDVHEAANGEAALEVLAQIVPDLIVMDLQMPVMNGWELHAAIKRDDGLTRVPIAVLSSAANPPADVARVLRKPVTLPKLLGLIELSGA